MKINMREISRLTGFSPATVSNALNHKHGVNAETAATIIAKAKELGYYDDSKISKIKFVIFKKKGYVVENTPFFTQMIAGVETEGRKCGFDVIICNLDQRESNYEEQLQGLLDDHSSAIIFLGTEMEDGDVDILRKFTVPLVVIDYWKEDMSFDSILINNADSFRGATERLIHCGHRRIGYLKGDFRIKPFRSRYAGYRTALEKAGLELEERHIVELHASLDGAYQDMNRYLKSLDHLTDLPTAFVADNDMIALGAMRAMEENQIRVPEDVSIIGFDDITYSSISNPPLTTIRVPKMEMGKTAVRRLRDIMEDGEGFHLKIQACTEFIERNSVREKNSD